MHGISHTESGEGPPLILLHGFCETREIWDGIAEELSQSFHLFIPDLPGFGKSKLITPPFSLGDVGREVWEWIDDKKIGQPIVIGHSLGGYVALAMASQHPAKIKGLGLFHSTASADTAEKKENRNKVIDFVIRNGVGPFVDTFVPGLFNKKDHPSIKLVDKICRQTTMETLLAYTGSMRDRPDNLAFISDFDKPVLIIAGENDDIIPVENLEKQAAKLKKGQFYTLRETGHMGMFEAPAKSTRLISSFAVACQ